MATKTKPQNTKPTKSPKSQALDTAPTTGKSLANIDAELAAEVADIKRRIGQPGGNQIKAKPSGTFETPDKVDLGNEIRIIVLDFISANRYYGGVDYDPANPLPPVCYAMSKIIADMVPEDDSPQKQNNDCGTCALNKYKSHRNGRAKACKNTRDIAFLLVDDENPEAHLEPDAPIYTMSLPPTAITSYEGAVRMVLDSLGGPPIKAILTVHGEVGHTGTYCLISFSTPEPNPDYAANASRRAECADLLFRKPDFTRLEKAAPSRRQAPPARGGARR